MSEQLAITLAAASIGVVSAIFFCIGNAFNTTATIVLQSGAHWDFNGSLARALSAQRAQYSVGALLLLAAFCLQVVAALASSATPAILPQWLATWPRLVLAVLVPTGLLSWLICWRLDISTIRRVLQAHQAEAAQEENAYL